MGFRYLDGDVKDIVTCKPLAIEKALKILRVKLDFYAENMRNEENIYQEFGEGKEGYEGEMEDAMDKFIAERQEKEVEDKKEVRKSKKGKF